jgi:hypothetical protein
VTGVEVIASDISRNQCRAHALSTFSTLGRFSHPGIRGLKSLDHQPFNVRRSAVLSAWPFAREVAHQRLHRKRACHFACSVSTQPIGHDQESAIRSDGKRILIVIPHVPNIRDGAESRTTQPLDERLMK